MERINLITLSSSLGKGDPVIAEESKAFLNEVGGGLFEFGTFADAPTLFYVETGGSEMGFKEVYEQYRGPYYLLVKGDRNSLAASLEILSMLNEKGKEGEILYGEPKSLQKRLCELFSRPKQNLNGFQGKKFGIIGEPSSWLIGSSVDKDLAKSRLGVELVDIPLEEFYKRFDQKLLYPNSLDHKYLSQPHVKESLYIHGALKSLILDYGLEGFTLRCFDLLSTRHETSCLSFALLNEEGYISSCEGDVPAMLTMYLAKLLTGGSSFMCNPSRIDFLKREIVLAHCTVPLDMVEDFTLTTHFESGEGIGVKGELRKGEVTLLKLKSDLSAIRAMEGEIVENLSEPNLCRTQIKVRVDSSLTELLQKPFGNHLIVTYGHHAKEAVSALENYLKNGSGL